MQLLSCMVLEVKSDPQNYHKEHSMMGLSLLFGLLIVTLGFYTIIWFFLTNRLLEKANSQAPDNRRVLVLLFLLPLICYIVLYFLHQNFTSVFLNILGGGIWLLLFLLIGKYFFDFCLAFAQITHTHWQIWFALLCLSLFGLFGLVTNTIWLIPFLFFLFFSCLLMQHELNAHVTRISRQRDKMFSYGFS